MPGRCSQAKHQAGWPDGQAVAQHSDRSSIRRCGTWKDCDSQTRKPRACSFWLGAVSIMASICDPEHLDHEGSVSRDPFQQAQVVSFRHVLPPGKCTGTSRHANGKQCPFGDSHTSPSSSMKKGIGEAPTISFCPSDPQPRRGTCLCMRHSAVIREGV